MQRVAFPSLLATVLVCSPAIAGPLDIESFAVSPPSEPGAVYAAPIAAGRAPVRTAASNYGGGFIEMLFGAPGAPPPQQPNHYQSEPERQYQPEPEYAPAYRRPRSEAIDPDPDRIDPSASALQPAGRGFDPRYERQEVNYSGSEPTGTIIINTRERMLYLVQGNGRALRYGIGVGRPGFTWAGTHHVTNMREWPDWRPPAEMIRRQPNLPRYMPGGPNNPLGARAMYLGSTLYRIHGSNEPWTIGHAVSSGCIRMRNQDVIDLYGRVRVGTKVVVI